MVSARWVSFYIILYSILLWTSGAMAGVVCEEKFPRIASHDIIIPGKRVSLSLTGLHLSRCFPGHTLEWLNPWEGARLEHQPAQGQGLEQWLIHWEAPSDLAVTPLEVKVAVTWKGQREVQTFAVAVRRCEDFDFELPSQEQTLYVKRLSGGQLSPLLPANFPRLECQERLALTVLEAPPGFEAGLWDGWSWTPPKAGVFVMHYEVALGARVKRARLRLRVEEEPMVAKLKLPPRTPLDPFGLRLGLLVGGGGGWSGPGLEVLFKGEESRGGFIVDLIRLYGFADLLLSLGQDTEGPLAMGGVGLQVGKGLVTLGSEVGLGSLDEEVFLWWTPSYHLYSLRWRRWALGVSAGYTFSTGEPPAVPEGPTFRVSFVPLE